MIDPTSTTLANPVFEHEAEAILHELRLSLAMVLEGLRPPVTRAAMLLRLLGLDKKLSWAVFNAATARDARVLASVLPGRRAIERFFTAAAGNGVPPEVIERARAAYDRFERSVARHAGSRDAFETMVSELRAGTGESGGADLKHKRAAFRALSLLFGRQARAFCGATIMHPGGTNGLLDVVFIKGMVGLRRTRRSVPLQTITHQWRDATPGDPDEPAPPIPLDPRESGPGSLALLRDFCSQPLPEFVPRVSRPGYRSHELVSKYLGSSGEVTYFTGEVSRDAVPVPGSAPGSEMTISKVIDIPLEVNQADMLVHRSIWGTRAPEVGVYAWPLDGSPDLQESDLLPISERAEYLGDGIDAARTPRIPRYAEMLLYAMDRMAWRPDEFRVFRCSAEYPVLHTRISMTLR